MKNVGKRWDIYEEKKTNLKSTMKILLWERTSCHGRCRAPGCFVVFFVFFRFLVNLFDDGVGWGGLGWGGVGC